MSHDDGYVWPSGGADAWAAPSSTDHDEQTGPQSWSASESSASHEDDPYADDADGDRIDPYADAAFADPFVGAAPTDPYALDPAAAGPYGAGASPSQISASGSAQGKGSGQWPAPVVSAAPQGGPGGHGAVHSAPGTWMGPGGVPMPPPTSVMAVIGLVLGAVSIISCMPVLALPGLILSLLGRAEVVRGKASGGSLAIIGIALSGAVLVLACLFILAYLGIIAVALLAEGTPG